MQGMRLLQGGLLGAVLLLLGAAAPAGADHSIYFPHVAGQLGLDAGKRAEVQAIMARSERETLAVFAKHGIDPNATPDWHKLFNARGALEAIERRERNLLKKILNKDQLKTYDRIMQYTRAQVIKATRKDN